MSDSMRLKIADLVSPHTRIEGVPLWLSVILKNPAMRRLFFLSPALEAFWGCFFTAWGVFILWQFSAHHQDIITESMVKLGLRDASLLGVLMVVVGIVQFAASVIYMNRGCRCTTLAMEAAFCGFCTVALMITHTRVPGLLTMPCVFLPFIMMRYAMVFARLE